MLSFEKKNMWNIKCNLYFTFYNIKKIYILYYFNINRRKEKAITLWWINFSTETKQRMNGLMLFFFFAAHGEPEPRKSVGCSCWEEQFSVLKGGVCNFFGTSREGTSKVGGAQSVLSFLINDVTCHRNGELIWRKHFPWNPKHLAWYDNQSTAGYGTGLSPINLIYCKRLQVK